MNKQLTLRIHSVKCLDETGGKFAERFGNDEIFLAGFGIAANGSTVNVNPFLVHAHFDDGDIRKFSPPRNFVTLSLTNNSVFPKTCTVGFLLAERDAGDFGSMAAQIFNEVKAEMNKNKDQKESWEKVKQWIKDNIIPILQDDMFPPSNTSVTIPSANFTWNGSKVSPPSAVQFRGHGGVYLMTYDWVLS